MVPTFATCIAWVRQLARQRDLPHQLTRFGVVSVLLIASVLKSWSLATADTPVGIGDLLTGLLALAELAGAVILSVQRPGNALWAFYTLAFVAFAGVSGYFAWHGAPTCRCFGNLAVPPTWTLVLDLALVTAILAFPPPQAAMVIFTPSWSGRLAGLTALFSLAVVGSELGRAALAPPEKEIAPGVVQRGDELILMPSKWVGHPLPILDWLGPEAEWLRTGEWELWMVDPECATCRTALSRLREQSRPFGLFSRRALLILGEEIGDHSFDNMFAVSAAYRGSDETRIVCPVPTCLTCRDSIVVRQSLGPRPNRL